MDAIVLKQPYEIVYRAPQSADAPAPPPERVQAVHPACVPAPAPAAPAAIENMCGVFLAYFDPARYRGVQTRATWLFGRPHEMYHVDGNVYVHRGRAHFRACRSGAGIRRLADALRLERADCNVHMCVFRLALGRRVHTDHGCYMENRLSQRFRSLRVCCRMLDMNALIKLRIDCFDSAEMPFFAAGDAPTCVDVTVSGQGIVICRVSHRARRWDDAREATLLRFCDWLGAELAACC